MTRQQLIDDFKHFLETHKEEVKSHLVEPQIEWFDEDGWDDEKDDEQKGEQNEKRH